MGKLTQLQGSIKGLSSSAGAIPIQKLQALGNVKVSTTTANGIAAIGKAVEGLPGAARMAAFGSMARSMQGLTVLNDVRLTKAINGLKRLPAGSRDISSASRRAGCFSSSMAFAICGFMCGVGAALFAGRTGGLG